MVVEDRNRLSTEWMEAAHARSACDEATRRRIEGIIGEARALASAAGLRLSGAPEDAHADLDALQALVDRSDGSGLPAGTRRAVRTWTIDLALRTTGGWWAPAPPPDLELFFPEPVPGLGSVPLSEPRSAVQGPWLPRIGIVHADRPRLRDWWTCVADERTAADRAADDAWRARRDAVTLREIFAAGETRFGALVRTKAESTRGPVIGPTGLLELAGRKWDDPNEALAVLGLACDDGEDGWSALRAQMKQGGSVSLGRLRERVLVKRGDYPPAPEAAARYDAANREELVAGDVEGAANALVLLATEPSGCIYGARLAEHLNAMGFRVRHARGEGEIIAGRWAGETPAVIACCRVVSDALGRVRTAERQNGRPRIPAVLTGGVPPVTMLPAAQAAGADAVCMVGDHVVESLLRAGWPDAFARMCAARGVSDVAGEWPPGAAAVGTASARQQHLQPNDQKGQNG